MADEFERAVLICLNPADHSSIDQSRAFEAVNAASASPDAPNFALARLTPGVRPEVAFWCMQVLHNRPSSSARPRVTAYASAVVSASAGDAPPPFVRNKLAQVIVAHIAVEYPATWPGAMREFVLPLATNEQTRTPGSMDLFFRILRTLDNEVTSIAAAQSSDAARKTSVRVKDAIRDDCAGAFVQLLGTLVRVPLYADHAFDLVARFVEWLDIGLFANDVFLPIMYSSITSATPAAARASSAYALRCIILKRMPMQSKHSMFQHLQILQLLASIPQTIPSDNDGSGSGGTAATADISIQSGHHETAMLVNSISNVALDMLKSIIATAKKVQQLDPGLIPIVHASGEIAEAALPLALRFVTPDMEETLSTEILNGVTAYINVFGRLNALENPRQNGNNLNGAGHATGSDGTASVGVKASRVKGKKPLGHGGLPQEPEEVVWTRGQNGVLATLQVVEERACYPPEFDPTDEEDSFFSLRRMLLGKVVQGLARGVPSVVLSFARRIAAEPTTASSVVLTELVLTTLNILAAVSLQPPGLTETLLNVMSNPPRFPAPTQEDTEPVARQLDAVHLAHHELVVRCYRLVLVSQDPNLLMSVLAPFFDSRGLMHPSSPALRSRTIYLLLKLTRSLRAVIASQHLASVMGVVNKLIFPIANPESGQIFQDQMNLFELAGYLVGSDPGTEESSKHLGAILGTLVNLIGVSSGLPERVALITAAGYLSKGFGGDSKPKLFAGSTEGSPPTSPSTSVLVGSTIGESLGSSPSGLKDMSNGTEVKVQKAKPLPEQALTMWRACLETTLEAVGLMGPKCTVLTTLGSPLNTEVRDKTVFFLHRMVDTMGAAAIPYLGAVMGLLLKSSSSPAEVRSTIVLASQAVGKFGASCESVMTGIFADVVSYVLQNRPEIDPSALMAMSEVSRERVDLQKAYHYFVHAMLGNKLTRVLGVADNPQLFFAVVSSVVQGFGGETVDIRAAPTIMKMCAASLSRMLETCVTPFGVDTIRGFGDPSSGQTRGFSQYLLDELSVMCIKSLVTSTLFRRGELGNGAASAFIAESVALQRTCAARLGPAFGAALVERGFRNVQSAPEVASYMKALYEPNTPAPTLVKLFIYAIRKVRG